jgi:YHS domain-containing protein
VTRRTLLISFAATLATAGNIAAQAPQSRPPMNVDKAGLAIQGYDPVAYHTLGKPTKGLITITSTHEGSTYRFATADHKTAFDTEPARYVPQYGGYCAYAVANGYTAAVDPTAWKVVQGKLYLNYNAAVAKNWATNTSGYIKSGDANWIDWRKLKKG